MPVITSIPRRLKLNKYDTELHHEYRIYLRLFRQASILNFELSDYINDFIIISSGFELTEK